RPPGGTRPRLKQGSPKHGHACRRGATSVRASERRSKPVNGLLVDVNIRKHGEMLLGLLHQHQRVEVWEHLACGMPTFEELGLARDSSDLLVWRTCQHHQLVLLTANRNDEGEETLEWVIRTLNRPESLPVLTLAGANRFLWDPEYRQRVADKVLEHLFDM